MSKPTIIRITTVPQSLAGLLKGQLRFMNQYFDVIGISSPGDRLEQIKEQEGIEVVALAMTRTISPLKDLMALWKLVKVFKCIKPQIVHTHTPKAGTIGMVAALLAGVPIRLHTVAGLPLMEATGLKRLLLDTVEKLTYASATRVYPNSNGLSQFIVNKKYCKKNKIKVIGNGSSNGIDTGYFSLERIEKEELAVLKTKYKLEEMNIVFCFVGRLVSDKGINELVAAFLRIYKIDPNARLLLVGPFEKDLDRLSDETEANIFNHPGIIWTDYQRDVRPFLALSDILTFPSYREGFPNVVMQAGAMNLPCIVSDINGCNEIISEGVNGLVIPPKNSDALYNAMKYLLMDKMCRKELAANARQNIVDKYDRQYVWDQLLTEYQSVT
ncbi:MAG: glycosyltransferase family 4 protein [Salinivirgaceae bacterium]|nr:glycosyltransferase family 4 protein [Salinivirgaceae bacterium]